MKRSTIIVSIVVIAALAIAGYIFISNRNQPTASSALLSEEEYYTILGIKDGQPEAWEDGMRTNGQEGSYEWWYTDAEFDDGTKIVVVFYTKAGFDVPGPAQPTVTIDITFPDGTSIQEFFSEEAGNILNASTEKADVKIGDSYIRDMGDYYEMKYAYGDIVYEATMKTTIPMWRPGTGHWFFDQENYFAWIVAQPSSTIEATLKMDGTTTQLTGTGYHDHNWGNIAMNEVINHWYWGRAKIGEYDVITADIISEKEYGYTRAPVIMIAKDGEVIEDDQSKLVVTRSDTVQHPITNKFIDNHITFTLIPDDGPEYQIEYIREKDILVSSLLDMLPSWQKFLARMIGANPTYIRSVGTVILTVNDSGNTTTIEQEGLWEQMFFGNNKEAHIDN